MADKTSSSIVVAAPGPHVMSVIADFPRYPDWATGVRAAEVLQAGPDGRARSVRFDLDAGMIRDRYVLAYQWDGDAGVRWELSEPGTMISELTGGYALAPDAGGTRVTYELAVGLRVPMPGMLKRRAEKTIIDTALKGLRTRAESAAAGTGGSHD
jgi:Polyketide cyclase / dehydrase and lipid transport